MPRHVKYFHRILILGKHELEFPFPSNEILGHAALFLNHNGSQLLVIKCLTHEYTNWGAVHWKDTHFSGHWDYRQTEVLPELSNATKSLCETKSTVMSIVEPNGFSSVKETFWHQGYQLRLKRCWEKCLNLLPNNRSLLFNLGIVPMNR